MGQKQIPIEEINNRLPANSLLKAVEYLEGRYITESGIKRRMVKCQCQCGNTKNCIVATLVRGNPLSCGCAKRGAKKGGKRKQRASGMKYKKKKVVKLNRKKRKTSKKL